MSFVEKLSDIAEQPVPNWIKWTWIAFCLPGWVFEGVIAVSFSLVDLRLCVLAITWICLFGFGIYSFRGASLSRESILFFSMPFGHGACCILSLINPSEVGGPSYLPALKQPFLIAINIIGLATLIFLIAAPFFMAQKRVLGIVAAILHFIALFFACLITWMRVSGLWL